jgi:predicted permease
MWQSIREFILRAAGAFRKRHRDREIAEELEFHLALKEASCRENEVASSDAVYQAHRDFGGLERWKERCRDASTIRFVEDLQRDLWLAFRTLRKSPIFSCIAIAILAAAIGANTTIFSLLNAVLLKSVNVPHADRLILLRVQPGEYGYGFNYPWFRRIEQDSSSLMQVFGFVRRDLRLTTLSGIEGVSGQLVSGAYFPVLRVAPKMGRYIVPRDDRPGIPDGGVAVISGAFWHSHFGSDPKILGRQLKLNQVVFTIVGVMPDSFRGMDHDQHPDVFIPLESEPLVDAPSNSIAAGYRHWWMWIGARLNNGVSREQAAAYLKAKSFGMTHGKETPLQFKLNGYKLQDLYITAEPGLAGYSYVRFRFAKPLRVLMTLVGLVLFVACLNLATLLMARAAARRGEIATRFALGATRSRLVRQLLTECLLISLAGTVLGLLAALLLTRALTLLIAPQHGISSLHIDTAPNWTVFAFTAAIALAATLLTGVGPALRSTGRRLENLREASFTLRAAERRRFWPRALLALEVAVALVLVTGASLLGYSLVKLHQVPLGFDPAGLVHVFMDTDHGKIRAAALPEMYQQLTERLKGLPSVSDVSICQYVPFSDAIGMTDVTVPGRGQQALLENSVGPGYFGTMRTSVREGREFRWSDSGTRARVVILNTAAEKAIFSSGHALGQHVSDDGGKTWLEIVGVVEDAKYSSVRAPSPPTIYYPATLEMENGVSSWTFLLRVSGPEAPVISSASKIIHQSAPELPAPAAISMEQTVNEALASERMLAMLAAFFGTLALVITGIGLYGTLAYMTERRTGEIGIRMALGATRSNIAFLVAIENGVLAFAGCVVGLTVSLMASKQVASFLFGITPHDPFAFGAAVFAVLLVAVTASGSPAVRATRIDPISAIRYE